MALFLEFLLAFCGSFSACLDILLPGFIFSIPFCKYIKVKWFKFLSEQVMLFSPWYEQSMGKEEFACLFICACDF